MGGDVRQARSRGRGNLPAELTSFVGRDRELELVTRGLSTSRLVTLVGPGGVGKTRLALRAAHRLRRAFPDGTWLVDLAALRDPTLLAQHVAAALDLRDESGRWLVATLADYLSRRPLLLLFDNCEHLINACAALARSLLLAGSELRILATSREPLGITGESLIQVPPLDADGHALRLFTDRAWAVRPDFQLTDVSRPMAVELCRRLDGIPLAIELAAARMRGLALEDVVQRLEDRFSLLSTGDRSGPARHQTLQAVLDWSHDLLTPDQRVLWRRLAVFAGGFDTVAAQAICADPVALPADRIVGALTGLTERSIVQLDDPLHGRYRMLETIRDYGALAADEAGELDEMRTRHRDHYLRLARQAASTWASGEQASWFRRLSADHANLREAFERCRETPDGAAIGLEVAARLWLWWQAAGRLGEGRRWISTFLELAAHDGPSRPIGLWAAGYLALVQRDAATGEAILEEALALARRTGDEEAESYAVGHLGLARLFAGSYAEARALFAESVVRHRRGGRPGLAAFQLADAALAAMFGGDSDTAIPEFEESLATCRRLGDTWTESHALWGLGMARWRRGEAAADPVMRQALALMRDVGDRTGVALCLEGLVLTAAGHDHARAAWLAGAADAAWEAIPAPPPAIVVALRERAVRAARTALGDRRFAALVAAGKATDRERALADALGERHERRPEPTSARSLLTRREEEVARLVADGLTNREIAARLVLSPRTIESHVERIMDRLGVGSRTEIAAWTAREPTREDDGRIP